ncbi:MAG: HRDC domain-containing protein [Spirochaetes bacterium]|uniref:HRDC domain-containing protein n=1 Tax=Candidatus Ornithospirochaeta stercoripullorum TaxID=2840899 RepID=A0A9D9H5V3_9SPIO|nr:HRDC domain-containing protein [Candidatus Ornithospirochaeta stercoripullorum]
MDYVYLDSDEKIEKALVVFSGKKRIAVDFEGEFNLHIYGEHLCLVQIYDGTDFYIIDPRSSDVSVKALEHFFSLPVEKVWFDCQSDSALVNKVYGLKICNVFDVRVLAKMLGYSGNLKAVESEFLSIDNEIPKKKNQQANWLKRPLPEEQIAYALEDVHYLLELQDVLVAAVKAKGLEKAVGHAMHKATAVKKIDPPWTKTSGWKRMDAVEKIYARHIWIARDRIARRFNVPASWVMEKHLIPALAQSRPRSEAELVKHLSSVSDRFIRFLLPALKEELKKADEEAARKL